MPHSPRPSRPRRPEPVVSAHTGNGRYRGGALTGALDGLRPTSKSEAASRPCGIGLAADTLMSRPLSLAASSPGQRLRRPSLRSGPSGDSGMRALLSRGHRDGVDRFAPTGRRSFPLPGESNRVEGQAVQKAADASAKPNRRRFDQRQDSETAAPGPDEVKGPTGRRLVLCINLALA